MAKEKSSSLLTLTTTEKLLRHNPETWDYWSEKDQLPEHGVFSHSKNQAAVVPTARNMTKDITLFSWQKDCVNSWLKDKRGTIKVVTGAGFSDLLRKD